jgi:hypothetical protein
MKYDPQKHHRQSIRLQGYDYSQAGAYFLTLFTYQRQCLFGEIIGGAMQLNPYGQVVAEEWARSQTMRREIELDQWVIMPNHFHGIVLIQSIDIGDRLNDSPHDIRTNGDNMGVGANGRSPLRAVAPSMKPRSLSSLLAGFKSAVTKQTYQLPARRARNPRLAAQLLRTHHPRRTILPHPTPIYCQQSPFLGTRPITPQQSF